MTKKTSDEQDINKVELEKRESRMRRKAGEKEKRKVKGNLRSNKQDVTQTVEDE
jgi:hypothetical protein